MNKSRIRIFKTPYVHSVKKPLSNTKHTIIKLINHYKYNIKFKFKFIYYYG